MFRLQPRPPFILLEQYVPLSLLMNYMFDGEHVSNEFKPLARVFQCFQLKLKTFRIITGSNPPGGGGNWSVIVLKGTIDVV